MLIIQKIFPTTTISLLVLVLYKDGRKNKPILA